MESRLAQIADCIASIENVTVLDAFRCDEYLITGNVSIVVGKTSLQFEVQVLLPYPLQFHDSDTIRFINNGYITYDHVNADGSVCIHTTHSPDLSEKLRCDFDALFQWAKKYYINQETDA